MFQLFLFNCECAVIGVTRLRCAGLGPTGNSGRSLQLSPSWGLPGLPPELRAEDQPLQLHPPEGHAPGFTRVFLSHGVWLKVPLMQPDSSLMIFLNVSDFCVLLGKTRKNKMK